MTMWDWDFAREILPHLAEAAVVTIWITLLAALIAMILGLVIAVAQIALSRRIGRVIHIITGMIRGTPLLLQLYFFFYVLPEFGLVANAFAVGVVALGLHYSTYTSEVYKTGIENVGRGQWEAALACNLSIAHTWTRVIIPQSIPPMLPALGNYIIVMFKETPMLSAITIVELMGRARIISTENYRYVEPVTMVGLFFLVISLVASSGIRLLERRFPPAHVD